VTGAVSLSTANFNFNGGTVTGMPVLTSSALSIGAGGTAPVTFIMRRSSSTLSGDIPAGHTAGVQGSNASGTATLTAAGGISNAGTIHLESIDSTQPSKLTVSSGTLTDAATGVINVNPSTGGARTVTAELNNSGTVNANTSFTFGRFGANHVNSDSLKIIAPTATAIVGNSSSAFNNAAGGVTSGDGTLDVTGVSFTNNGTLSPEWKVS
jgi:hypothetical protein